MKFNHFTSEYIRASSVWISKAPQVLYKQYYGFSAHAAQDHSSENIETPLRHISYDISYNII